MALVCAVDGPDGPAILFHKDSANALVLPATTLKEGEAQPSAAGSRLLEQLWPTSRPQLVPDLCLPGAAAASSGGPPEALLLLCHCTTLPTVEGAWCSLPLHAVLETNTPSPRALQQSVEYLRTLEFVRACCAGRPVSHGLAHMVEVAEVARALVVADGRALPLLHDVNLAALLHDVADHKYASPDNDLAAQVAAFAQELGKAWLVDVTEAVSFSKESRRGLGWYRSSLTPEQCLVRDYVSDADKLLALGAEGVQRMQEYSLEIDPGMSEPTSFRRCFEHCHDKLYLLPGFLHSPTARIAARDRVDQLKDCMLHWANKLLQ